MTRTNDEPIGATKPEVRRPQEPPDASELDTEIVRDLEADQAAAAVRGAACPTSRPITKDR